MASSEASLNCRGLPDVCIAAGAFLAPVEACCCVLIAALAADKGVLTCMCKPKHWVCTFKIISSFLDPQRWE